MALRSTWWKSVAARALAVLALAGLAQAALARPVPLDQLTIADVNAAFDAGTLTSEKLVRLSLARIAAYDRAGPQLRAVIHVNPKAIATARALDAERRARGPRSPLHGIPVVLKDNIDTFDMPTTGASVLLEGSVPPDDAFVVKKLRDAGAIILAKLNMAEFASSSTNSSMGGQARNPHDLTRTPAGSSSGSGVAIAAAYAPVGLGTDTGGSIRGPSSANGIAGLKPTYGLLSHDGIIPLALTLDMAGPMARNVHDLAVSLGVMAGVDPADESTRRSAGRSETDYTRFLDASALKGARIGIARDLMKRDAEVDWIVEAALETMRRQGATIVDVTFPAWMEKVAGDFYDAIRLPEFAAQIGGYLATIGPQYPKTLPELIERAGQLNAPRADGAGPNPMRWALFNKELASGSLEDFRYLTVRDHGLPLMRAALEAVFAANNVDAIIRPLDRPALLVQPPAPTVPSTASFGGIANLTGIPDLVVPAGFTADDLPVTLSFWGRPFSEARLLALAYSYEQASHARRLPVLTPPLPGELIEVPERRR